MSTVVFPSGLERAYSLEIEHIKELVRAVAILDRIGSESKRDQPCKGKSNGKGAHREVRDEHGYMLQCRSRKTEEKEYLYTIYTFTTRLRQPLQEEGIKPWKEA